MTNDYPRLVLDANIMISALVGRSFPILLNLFERGVLLFAPLPQLAETRRKIGDIAALPHGWVDEQMERLAAVVIPLHPVLLEKHETIARSRLAVRGQPDWPILAGCYEVRGAAWSHDKDLFGSGVAVWSTSILVRQIDFAKS